jgi:ATP-dependent exoDNAse (exonuclease V) alpha subunit
MNLTWDPEEETYKAGQFRDLKRDAPYYEGLFHKMLADHLTELGYRIRKTDKSFEVEGIPQKVIDLFSKRTNEIGRIAREQGITDAKELDQLGARTRSKKQKGHSMAELKRDWRRQIRNLGMSDAEGCGAVRYAHDRQTPHLTAKECIDYSVAHRLERVSVIQDRRLLETAYRHAIGHDVSIEAITKEFQDDTRILRVKEKGRTMVTTKQVLEEERHMVELAKRSKGKLRPLCIKEPELDLDGDQAEAVRHVLTTTHRVSIIRGRAGTGKTTLMREAVKRINEAGRSVTVVAPTSEASRGVLRREGFENADTVESLLGDPQRHKQLKGQVLWVDEAGLLGTKDMTALLRLVEQQNARLILSGDTRQHSSVVRGDALRILNTVAGIRSAEVSRIYRQITPEYRDAVQALSDGEIGPAFAKLDTLGAIKTIDPLNPNDALVNDYLDTIKKGRSALVISPTHKQGEETTRAIRDKLREAGLIDKNEIRLERLHSLNLTEAEKGDLRNYRPGLALQFNQNRKGIRRGSVWTVRETKDNQIELADNDGKTVSVPISDHGKFDLYHKSEIALSQGDKVRVTRNGFDAGDKHLNNGQTFEILKAEKTGTIRVRSTISDAEYDLPRDFAHIAHAHVITSYSGQGKTCDEIFIAQPSSTFPATDIRQFYVSVSRGRLHAHIYTDDKEALLEHASRIGERQSALELVASKDNAQVENIIRQNQSRQCNETVKDKLREKLAAEKSKRYEREPI